MPAKKGQKHRSYTYYEKKFNKFNERELLEEMFLPKYDPDRVWVLLKEETGEDLPQSRIKKLILMMESKDRKALDRALKEEPHLRDNFSSIFNLKRGISDLGGLLDEPLTNLEAVAIYVYVGVKTRELRASGGRLTEKKKDDLYLEALHLLVTDWDKCIDYALNNHNYIEISENYISPVDRYHELAKKSTPENALNK